MEEHLQNGAILRHGDGSFRLSTDSMLLVHFAAPLCTGRVADLGAGCGTLGLLLCAANESCTVTGVELDPAAHAIAEENIARSGLSARMRALLGDVREIRTLLPAGGFDAVVSNPPYFPVGSGRSSAAQEQAREERTLTLSQLCAAAAWLLPSGGRFALVHRPERLCDIFCTLRAHGLEPKRLQFVRHTAAAPVCLVLIEARRGGKSGLRYAPDFIEFHPDGTETEQYRAAYHRGESQ